MEGSSSLFGKPKREERRGLGNATAPTSGRTFKGCPSTNTTCDLTKNAATSTTSTGGSNRKVKTQIHGPQVSDAGAEQRKSAAGSSRGSKDIDGAGRGVEVNATTAATSGAEYLDGSACAVSGSEEGHGH